MTALWGEAAVSPSKAVGVPEKFDRLEGGGRLTGGSPSKGVGVPEQYNRLIGGGRLIPQ